MFDRRKKEENRESGPVDAYHVVTLLLSALLVYTAWQNNNLSGALVTIEKRRAKRARTVFNLGGSQLTDPGHKAEQIRCSQKNNCWSSSV